jgi:hypothetical protein
VRLVGRTLTADLIDPPFDAGGTIVLRTSEGTTLGQAVLTGDGFTASFVYQRLPSRDSPERDEPMPGTGGGWLANRGPLTMIAGDGWPARPQLAQVSGERRLASPTCASWNQLRGWLRAVDGLRCAA